MNAERFKLAAGIDTVHVPYKGTPEALGDTMNGRTDIYFCPVIAALPMIRDKPRGGAGQRQPQALVGAARPADHGGTGLQGQRLQFLGRPVRAGRHAAGGDRPPQRRGEEGARVARGQGAAGRRSAPIASPTTAAELDKIVAAEVKENIELAKKADIKLQ